MVSVCVCVQGGRSGGGTVLHHPGVQRKKDHGEIVNMNLPAVNVKPQCV